MGCKQDGKNAETQTPEENSMDDISAKEIEFKVLDSKVITNEEIWADLGSEVDAFSEEDYHRVKPLVFEKSIPEIQTAISNGALNYEDLVLFYLKRIKKYDRENESSLNSVISLNPNVLEEARELDKVEINFKGDKRYSVYGMPILLKDNVNTEEMPTTAGATVFKNNTTEDAFITKRLREHGALILGKANLSEWAYFFCGDCPSGYSAVGGQTLNPYGRKVHDTGGSSSGSGVSMAANFAAAAIGTETSGSILSPSSSNSIVGLKPTIGLFSRAGIVPISSTLDTPGPMTRTVIDNAIVMNALQGVDKEDMASAKLDPNQLNYIEELNIEEPTAVFQFTKLGYYKGFMEDSLYANAVKTLKDNGAQLVEIERPEVDLPQFVRVLNLDMKVDLPEYIKAYGSKDLAVKNMQEITEVNKQDSLVSMPYGQRLFYGVLKDSATDEEFAAIKDTLLINGKKFFDDPMKANDLDAVLSINNYMAGYAAAARYPALTVPMGYKENNQPMGLTFMGQSQHEALLLQLALAYESISQQRKSPEGFE